MRGMGLAQWVVELLRLALWLLTQEMAKPIKVAAEQPFVACA